MIEANLMEIKKLRYLLEETLSKMKGDLTRYALLLCSERGYCLKDVTLSFDDAALAPGIRVGLTPALRYDPQELNVLAAMLENNLDNIVFEHAYNERQKIGAEDSNPIKLVTYLNDYVRSSLIASQN
jgi:hypothetical protein